MKRILILFAVLVIVLPGGSSYAGWGSGWTEKLQGGTVAKMPPNPSAKDVYIVTDGADASDCTTGGGSTYNLCIYSGSAWVIAGDGGGTAVEDAAYGSGWNADTTNAPSQNAVYDILHQYDTNDDGDIDNLDPAAVANVVNDTTPQLGGPLDLNGKYLHETFASFTDEDTTPDVSGGTNFKTANTTGTKIEDFDAGAGALTEGHQIYVLIADSNTTIDFTSSGLKGHNGLDWSPSANDSMNCTYDDSGDWNCILSRPSSLGSVVIGGFSNSMAVNSDGSGNLQSSSTVSSTEQGYLDGVTQTLTKSAESADATLANLGEMHIRGDEDRVSYHMGAGGEVAGEVTKSVLEIVSVSVDPGAWYDSDTQIFLFHVHADVYPNGIRIDEWEVSCNVDPDVEMDLDLKRATAWIGLGSAALMDVLDTTTGTSSEDTDANINSNAVVAAGQKVYLEFGADPEGTCVQLQFTMLFHAEED